MALALRESACGKGAIRMGSWIRKPSVNKFGVALEVIFLPFQKTAASELSLLIN